MHKFSFSSSLKKKFHDSLDAIMFFNKNQKQFTKDIVRNIKKFGLPEIICTGDELAIKIKGLSDVQSIFAFIGNNNDTKLVGVIIYFRNTVENIIVIHIAVDEEYAITGKSGAQMLMMQLINKVREAVKYLRGVKSINIAFGENPERQITIPVR